MRKYIDTIAIISTLVGCVIWMNMRFNAIDKEITIIKTVLLMHGIYPKELAMESD